MADPLPPAVPLVLIEGETDGYCDPVTGLCAVPEATTATPAPDCGHADLLRERIDGRVGQ